MPIAVSSSDARTLGDLKTRIADELARADLAPQIALAIFDAIAEACTHRFWFMEERGISLPLAAGTAFYTSDSIEQLVEIDRLALIVGSRRQTLRPMNDNEVDRVSDGTEPRGEPWAYSRYGNGIRLYPTPQQAYTVLIDGVTNGSVLDSDLDSNIWTTTGERYIRALAKREVLAHVIQDQERAQVQDALALRYRQEFEAQTHTRLATGEMACNG